MSEQEGRPDESPSTEVCQWIDRWSGGGEMNELVERLSSILLSRPDLVTAAVKAACGAGLREALLSECVEHMLDVVRADGPLEGVSVATAYEEVGQDDERVIRQGWIIFARAPREIRAYLLRDADLGIVRAESCQRIILASPIDRVFEDIIRKSGFSIS